MSKKLLFTILAAFQVLLGFSQSNLWTKTSEERLKGVEKFEKLSMPSEYEVYYLNFDALKSMLKNAPLRGAGVQSNVIVTFPNSEGELERYKVYEAPVMHADLGAKHPDTKSYVGKNVDNPSSLVRFSVTGFGLHTMAFSNRGTEYIDTYTKDLSNYIVYNKKNLTQARSFGCEFKNDEASKNDEPAQSAMSTQANDGVLRTYRLAMACSIEYAAYHIDEANAQLESENVQKEVVLDAMVVTMTRVSFIYEKDLAVTFEIVPDNEEIIFLNSDNIDNEDGGYILNFQIQGIIDGAIGSSNYDIGHVVTTGGGGIASLGSVCTNGMKARGVTGSYAPVGDAFDVDYVAHEMGHQFGANHTFNASGSFQQAGSCAGNRNQSTSVEPGSGTTIMGYAGICMNADVQQHSDAYFNAKSLEEMFSFINGNGDCAAITNLDNEAPVIEPIADRTIPKYTPFILKGNGTDVNGDGLTYCWEQLDSNGSAAIAPTASATSGPNFRSLTPSESPDRYMPEFSEVLDGNLNPDWEVLPSAARTMKFALTVRDNHENGGQTAREDVTITVSNTGPFYILYPDAATGITWAKGSTQNITWSNNTSELSANVNILISTDNGVTFTTLLANTPNDGSESVLIPLDFTDSNNCRILIEAAENIFYTVSSNTFSISGVQSTEEFGLNDFVLYPNPSKGNFTLNFNSASSNPIDVAVYDMRGRQIFAKSIDNAGVISENINIEGAQAGVYLVTVQDGNRKEVKRVVVE